MRMITAFAVLTALFCHDTLAQGIVIERRIVETTPPIPPTVRRLPRRDHIRLTQHTVDIRIEDQAVVTSITQIFHNPNPWQAEGVYLFPLPDGASVSHFTLRMGNRDIPGEMLDSRRARDIYRRIVTRREDPGLLEYAGRRLIRASIFPIPARGDSRITLRYEQVLKPVGGVLELVYPMKSDRFAPGPVRISGRIDITSAAGIATLFSPSHPLDVVRKSHTHAVASFEDHASPADKDLRVLYSLGRKDFGLALSTHKPSGRDGTFMMLVSPHGGFDGAKVLPKDLVFVLDTSGSMGDGGGAKLRQARGAVTYALGRLHARDRFNVISFATEARSFREQPVDASPENVAAALEYVRGLEATGGTAIHDALQKALALPRVSGRVPLVIFLTDGMPTIGPSDSGSILRAAAQANKAGARVFVFGVGNDVNTNLLDDLADATRGAGHYVAENEDIEVKVSALYDKVASPVLTDVAVKIDGAGEYDVYPKNLGDLFKGQQLLLVGRYKNAGPRAVTLSGKVGGREVHFVYEGTFGTDPGQEYLPRLWAVRKVGFLMAEVRRNGETRELVEEIKRLGRRHGIVTPYTSFLVVDESELARARLRGERTAGLGLGGGSIGGRLRALEGLAADMEEADAALKEKKVSGRGAVAGARLTDTLRRAERYDSVGVKSIGAKSFRYRKGVWIDTSLTGNETAVQKIVFLSEAYDALLGDATLARYLSAGTQVKFAYKGTVYMIVAK